MSHIARINRSARIIHAAYMRGTVPHRIVSRPRGSWKYQDAYAIATYALVMTRDLRLVWRNIDRGPKRSLPQLRQADGGYPYRFGGLHNRPARAGDLV